MQIQVQTSIVGLLALATAVIAAPLTTTRSPYIPQYTRPTPTEYGHKTTVSPTSYESSTGVTSAKPTSSSATSTVPYASLGPCGKVSALASSFTVASPKATPTVPAQLAYECINSVPFNKTAALAYMDSIRPYVDWQTSIEYLKNPPSDYASKIQPAYDFYANWNSIRSKASAGSYASEYAFGHDVYEAFHMAHDGHFVVYTDSYNTIFSYGRKTPLVSVSLDGVSIPQVFVYQDILDFVSRNSTGTKPSPLKLINGEDSTEWLLNFSQVGSLQDRDALWNNMFYLLGQVSLGSSGSGTGTFAGNGRGRWTYPGPTTSLTFANGTTSVLDNFARVLKPFDGISTGADIYKKFFAVPAGAVQFAAAAAAEPTTTSPASTGSATSSTTSSAAATSAASVRSAPPGYPSPIIREKNNLNSGYFLSGEGFDDVAVLSVPSFVSTGPDEIPFQQVNTYLIDRAVAENKTKLIIDVSANGGGTILQGYDLFKQLFPHILPYGATRFRAHEALDYIGQETSYFSGMFPRSLTANNDTVQGLQSSAFNYRTDADINYQPFTSWAEKYGPHAYGPEPDNFTNIIRWNMSDVLTPLNSGGIYISGYLERANITKQPFKAENIIIVYDGYCASTCTIFSELMRQQAGVKTIALGGRPNKDIIQAVGGIKGTNDFAYDDIFFYAQVPYAYQYKHSAAFYNKTALGEYNDLVLLRSGATAINVRDGIRQGDTTGTPLQFRYEPADCRIYYTPAMAVDQTAAWKTVADTAFNGKNHCIAGGISKPYGYASAAAAGQSRVQDGQAAVQVPARADVDYQAHSWAIDEVWTGRGGMSQRADSVMLV